MKALARTYAEALADVAIEAGKTEQTKQDLAGFLALLSESADLRNFLVSPAVPAPAKHAVIERLVTRLGASQALRNFLFVIVDHRRSNLLAAIGQEFVMVLYTRLGITQAQVTSARELTEQEKTDLIRALERLTGKRVEARYRLSPELIGGAMVQIGSTIYDGSVRDQLDRLRARLAGS